jgi:hypothetical protein
VNILRKFHCKSKIPLLDNSIAYDQHCRALVIRPFRPHLTCRAVNRRVAVNSFLKPASVLTPVTSAGFSLAAMTNIAREMAGLGSRDAVVPLVYAGPMSGGALSSRAMGSGWTSLHNHTDDNQRAQLRAAITSVLCMLWF